MIYHNNANTAIASRLAYEALISTRDARQRIVRAAMAPMSRAERAEAERLRAAAERLWADLRQWVEALPSARPTWRRVTETR